MHDRMKPISLQGQEIILADLTADEVQQLNQLLHPAAAQDARSLRPVQTSTEPVPD